MKPHQACILLLLCLFLNIGCSSPNNKKALNELVKRNPSLFKNTNILRYKVVRMLYDGKDSINLQLLETGLKNDYSKIVVLSNNSDESYAIAFPENNYFHYWHFYGDSTSSTQNTFATELNNALKTLSIKTPGIIDNLFTSLLGSRRLFANDTLVLKNEISDKLLDTCSIIKTSNYKSIAIAIDSISDNYYYKYIIYNNKQEGRMYKLKLDYVNNTFLSYDIETYRHPCVIRPIYID